MRKIGVIAAAICVVCLILPFEGGGISLGMAQNSQRLASQEAIAAARTNAKPGSSFTVLREIVATDDTRRIGDQALEQARAHQIDLFGNRTLVDLLRTGGFLIAEYDPNTSNVVALHLVSLGPDGVPKDDFYPNDGAVKLADAEELVKDTAVFTEKLYSTPPSEAFSLGNRIYGGSFPECGGSEECTLFAVPRSLLKLGADPNEVREVAALDGGLSILQLQYAVSMPAFAASPLVATQASEGPIAEFLRENHMNPDFDFDLEHIQSKKQLRERIDMLRRMDKFMEAALKNQADPALVKANISVATIPLGLGTDTENGQVLYSTATPSGIVIYWQPLPAGSFGVHLITVTGE